MLGVVVVIAYVAGAVLGVPPVFERAHSRTAKGSAELVAYDTSRVRIPGPVLAHLREIAEWGRRLVEAARIEVTEGPPRFDAWPVVADDGAITLPSQVVTDPSLSGEAETLAFVGVATLAFRNQVLVSPYAPRSTACESAYRMLSPDRTAHPIAYGPASLAVWIASYANFRVSDTTFALTFERVFASTLAVLRYYATEFHARVARLEAPQRRAVLDFVRAIAATFPIDSVATLDEMVPAIRAIAESAAG